jgi:hypothetical protein
VEQALATLSYDDSDDVGAEVGGSGETLIEMTPEPGPLGQPDVSESEPTAEAESTEAQAAEDDDEVEVVEDAGDEVAVDLETELAGLAAQSPAYVAPPDPYNPTPLTPTLADISYMEDESQRQMYRVRSLATLVAVVALVIAFVWALGEGLGALGDWWDDFFGNLRL